MSEIDKVLEERGGTYGDYTSETVISETIKNMMRCGDGWLNAGMNQRAALDMIAVKIARICNGDPNHRDNWDDIIGYATLVSDRMIVNNVPSAPEV